MRLTAKEEFLLRTQSKTLEEAISKLDTEDIIDVIEHYSYLQDYEKNKAKIILMTYLKNKFRHLKDNNRSATNAYRYISGLL